MAEVRLNVEDEFLDELRELLGQKLKPVDLVREGMTLLYWAAEQRRAGRYILAGAEDGQALYRLSQRVLDRVPPATGEGEKPAGTTPTPSASAG